MGLRTKKLLLLILKLQKWISVNTFQCSNRSKKLDNSSTLHRRFNGRVPDSKQNAVRTLWGHRGLLEEATNWKKCKSPVVHRRNLPKSPVRPRRRHKILHGDKHAAAVRKTDVNPAPTRKTKYKWRDVPWYALSGVKLRRTPGSIWERTPTLNRQAAEEQAEPRPPPHPPEL